MPKNGWAIADLKGATHCLLCAALLLMATLAQADPQSKSWSQWQVDGPDVTGNFSIAAREMTRFYWATDRATLQAGWVNHLAETASLTADTGDCALQQAEPLPADPRYLRARLAWRCAAAPRTLELQLPLLAAVTRSHLHFAHVNLPDETRLERLFSYAAPQQAVDLRSDTAEASYDARTDVAIAYLQFGFEHILVGIDHIAFLIALMLLSARVGSLLWIVTGFTIGHSITLSLAALGLVQPSLALVEAVIGLTIAVTAIENVSCRSGQARLAALVIGGLLVGLALFDAVTIARLPTLSIVGLGVFCAGYLRLGDSPQRAEQLRPSMTLLFGLVHGFGFASVLLEVGLPTADRIAALVGFNVGVELGQIAIVGALALASWPLRHCAPRMATAAASILNAGLCALGTYWFVQRLYW